MINKEKADEEEDGDKTNHQEEMQVNLKWMGEEDPDRS